MRSSPEAAARSALQSAAGWRGTGIMSMYTRDAGQKPPKNWSRRSLRAVGGVVVGVAAQASLSNAVAGLVILFSRPFRTGQYVTVRAAAFAGSEYSGEVGEITLFY